MKIIEQDGKKYIATLIVAEYDDHLLLENNQYVMLKKEETDVQEN